MHKTASSLKSFKNNLEKIIASSCSANYRSTSFRTGESSHHHKVISLGGMDDSGLDKSIPEEFLCCVEQDGMIGVRPVPLTGVKPVPPSIRESKFNGSADEGVVIDTPATSSMVVGAGFDGKTVTGSELGLSGLFSLIKSDSSKDFLTCGMTESSCCIITLLSSSM